MVRPLTTTAQTVVQAQQVYDLTIAIPCFNEVDGIAETTAAILNYRMQHYPHLRCEMILVDDGSTDGTTERIQSLAAEHADLHPVYFPVNQGRGSAIKTIFKRAQGKHLIVLDADLSYSVEHIGKILACFEQSPNVGVVVVSPYMKSGIVQNVPFARLMLSRVANWILSGSFSKKLSTVTSVVRGYNTELVQDLPLFENGKELHLEILRKLEIKGAQIQEIPGALVWKKADSTVVRRRKNNLNVIRSIQRHLFYGLLMKPTRLFKYLGFFLLLLGLYETFNIVRSMAMFLEPDPSFWEALRKALLQSFFYSPHTFIIVTLSLILSFQTFSYLALFQLLKLQQEETLQHLLSVLENQKRLSCDLTGRE